MRVLILLSLVLWVAYYIFSWARKSRGKQKKRKAAYFYPPCAALLLLLIILEELFYYSGAIGNWKDAELLAMESKYSSSRAYATTNYLKNRRIIGRAMILVDPEYQKNFIMRELVETFVKQLAPQITSVIVPLKFDPKKYSVAELKSYHFDAVINDNLSCNVIISTIGLPDDYTEIDFLKYKMEDPPHLIVLNCTLKPFKLDLYNRRINMLIVNRPDAKISMSNVPSDPLEAFSQRYIMITSSEMIKLFSDTKYKKLF